MGTPQSEHLCLLRTQLCPWPSVTCCIYLFTHRNVCAKLSLYWGQPMTYTDIHPRSSCHVLSADKCQIMYTKCRNLTIWVRGWLNSPGVWKLIRMWETWVGVPVLLNSEHGLDVDSITFLMAAPPSRFWLFCSPFPFLSVCLWPEADTIFLMTSWTEMTHFWGLLSTNLFADGREKTSCRLLCFLPRWESSPCCDPL